MFRFVFRSWRSLRRWWRGSLTRQALPPAPEPEPAGNGLPRVESLEGDRVLATLGATAWLMSSREARRLALRLLRGASLARRMARWDAALADGECLGK